MLILKANTPKQKLGGKTCNCSEVFCWNSNIISNWSIKVSLAEKPMNQHDGPLHHHQTNVGIGNQGGLKGVAFPQVVFQASAMFLFFFVSSTFATSTVPSPLSGFQDTNGYQRKDSENLTAPPHTFFLLNDATTTKILPNSFWKAGSFFDWEKNKLATCTLTMGSHWWDPGSK